VSLKEVTTHLSLLLFILIVNSVTKWIIKAKLLLFLDDIKIFLKIDSLNQCHILQSELNISANWAHSIGVSLNKNKCHIMSFSRKRSPIHHNYSFNGTTLDCVFLYKDLGIHYIPSLNFEYHINVKVSKEIFFCSLSLHFIFLISMFNIGIWSGSMASFLAKDELRLESVQNRFLSYVVHIMKIEHPSHDYSLLSSILEIPLLSSC